MARTKAAAAHEPVVDTQTLDLLTEVAPAAGTALAIVKTPVERAVSALNSTAREVELAALVKKSADIVEVKNADARAQVHRMAMDLKNTRCAITKQSEEARSDATAFSKSVLAEERRLIAIMNPEEDRLFKLRDDFDTAEAEAKAELERLAAVRAAEIKAALDAITGLPAKHAAATSAELTVVLKELAAKAMTEAEFGDKLGEAAVAQDTTAAALIALHDGALAREQAEAERIRLQEEEKQRIADQAKELVRQQEVAAETKRQLDAQAAQVAADRKAQEQTLADLRAAQERQKVAMAEISALQLAANTDDTAVGLRRLIVEIEDKDIAEAMFGPATSMVQMAKKMAIMALSGRMRARVEIELPAAHAEALDDNALFDAEHSTLVEVEPLVMGCPTLSGAESEIDWDTLPECVLLPECSERDAEINAAPGPTKASDMEIVDLVASEYGMTRSQAIVRLAEINFKALEESGI